MLNLNSSTKFKKDFKLCIKRGYNMKLLQEVVDTLRIPAPLPPKNRDHALPGIGARAESAISNQTGC